MATLEITNNDPGSVVVWEPVYRDDVITFAGADTLLPGTILARDSSTLKLVIFVKGGSTNENGIPKAVLLEELVAAGSGDLPVRPLIGGHVRFADLVIDADADNSNVDNAVRDELRDFGLVVRDTQQLSELDNQT